MFLAEWSDFIGHVFEIYTAFKLGVVSDGPLYFFLLFRCFFFVFSRYLATSCSHVEQWRGLGRTAVVTGTTKETIA